MRIIPAIDLIEGKCVRLSKGDYNTKKIYNEDPLEVAKAFEAAGIRYLHLVDLDAAKTKVLTHVNILERIAAKTGLNIDFGGGVQTKADVKTLLDAGAGQVTLGSIAVRKPVILYDCLQTFGTDKIILGADCLNRKIATNAWDRIEDIDIISFMKEKVTQGVLYAIVTEISRDGMLQGPDDTLYNDILDQVPLRLIASGGISKMSDLDQLQRTGCEAAIIGKAIYEQRITLKQLESYA
ncbi:MAG: 1-(5-phosphoribosyl)-5-[(5-phosphoribosylamino)methylideneamino]imidazole-4-carboxamide isomerase [Bacteroidetes bacterium 43-16]|nr:MAG: 1-(5-phosphoribosyl)-5-[(5-phosphoribosylamino)methylideneamino]imidazole-4-carboxamide isomerase [Bacteroidetes bacterium 43-16]